MKRTLTTLAMVSALALPASASDCQTVTIEHEGVTPIITNTTGESPRLGIIGHFLVVTFDYADDPESVGQSVDVIGLDIIGATACTDGSIELARGQNYSDTDTVVPEVNSSPTTQTPIYLVPRLPVVGSTFQPG